MINERDNSMNNAMRLLIAGLLATSCNLFGMMPPEEVHIKNDLNRTLKVSWTKPSKEVVPITVEIGKSRKIDFDAIAPGSSIMIEAHGNWLRWTVRSLEIKRSILNAEFNELNPADKDNLEIALSQGVSIDLTPTYKIYVPIVEDRVDRDPMNEFKGMHSYSRLMHLKEKDIVGFKSFNTVVVPGRLGSRPTIALDVYRYMFGVPQDYSVDYVKQVFKEFAQKWHPDKGAHGTNKEYAQSVFNLARQAYQGLLDYHDPMYGVVIVEEEKEPVTERAVVVVDEEVE